MTEEHPMSGIDQELARLQGDRVCAQGKVEDARRQWLAAAAAANLAIVAVEESILAWREAKADEREALAAERAYVRGVCASKD